MKTNFDSHEMETNFDSQEDGVLDRIGPSQWDVQGTGVPLLFVLGLGEKP